MDSKFNNHSVMSVIIDVAPQGDLVVAAGQGRSQKIARISSGILKFASPVFNAMLGPSFNEGQTIHDASSPLELPDDDPVSILNLFYILHYNGQEANTYAHNWLPRLMIVCDKYGCISNVKQYLSLLIIGGPKLDLSEVDRFVIFGVIGVSHGFEGAADRAVRMSRTCFEIQCHLMPLLPEDMLEKMQEYRSQARAEYRSKARIIVAEICNAGVVRGSNLCRSLQAQIASLNKTLSRYSVVTSEDEPDSDYLPDMRFVVKFNINYSSLDQEKGAGESACPVDCKTCSINVKAIAVKITKDMVFGTSNHCKVCQACLEQRRFNFWRECTIHNKTIKQ